MASALEKVALIVAHENNVGGLQQYDAMCAAIEAAYNIDEVKHIRDKAIAIAQYCRQAKNFQAETDAARIRLRAEFRAGEMLAVKEKQHGARGKNVTVAGSENLTPQPETLSDLGITKQQSSDWQKLAKAPVEKFEAVLASDKPTLHEVIKPAYTSPPDASLWLWGRLRDFEREGQLDMNATEVVAGMQEHMLSDLKRLIPAVIEWLEKVAADVG